MSVELTPTEMYNELNDFDDVAIKKHFGSTLLELGQGDGVRFVRALVSRHLVREGVDEKEAVKQAREMRNGDVLAYFQEETDAILPEGKDSEPA